jgi:hypothetical protein
MQSLCAVGLSLEVFRKILNRPAAAVPRLGFYIIGSVVRPWLALWRRLFSAAKINACIPPTRYDREAMRNLLADHALRLEPKGNGLADVFAEGKQIAAGVIDPFKLGASSSLFLARYKVFLASGVALGYGAFVNQVSRLFHAEAVILPYVGVLFYPIVLVILWLMFDDLLTATVAPLPLIAIRIIIRGSHGFEGFVVAVVLTSLVIYLVEWFFVPRSLPPVLYLYTSDERSGDFHYKPGHQPYWLKGGHYWVWRFVTLAPAELLKFWEKDWERLEIWVRADGADAGKIEYIVTDTHYRELWFEYERLVGKRAKEYHAKQLARHRETQAQMTWVVDLDMDLVFHSPAVRGVYVASGARLSIGRRVLAILNVMFRKKPWENPDKYLERLEALEITGEHFLEDIPEHFRTVVTRRLLSSPWTYWRFPRGAKSARTFSVYAGQASLEIQPDLASERRYQIKAPLLETSAEASG